jgi:hypothetical protein
LTNILKYDTLISRTKIGGFMGRANLSYFINDKHLIVYSDLLVNIDNFTTKFKNDKDMFLNVPNAYRLQDFVEENKARGNFKIIYADKGNVRRIIPVLYDEPTIEVDDMPDIGVVSESEKTRRKLLNSKEQLYSRLFLLNPAVDNAKKLSINISLDEYRMLNRQGVYTYTKDNSYYVSIEDLIKYRATHKKLGEVRPLYEEALDIWKEKMDKLPMEEIYYLSREYRVVDNNYHKVMNQGITVSNLKVVRENSNAVKGRIVVKTSTPYVIKSRKLNKQKMLVA